MIDPSVRKKRRDDLLDDSEAGFDTSPQEDARLRQASPDEEEIRDWAQAEAESMTQALERSSEFRHAWFLTDPLERRKYRDGLAEELRKSFDGQGRLRGNQSPNAENRSQMSTGSRDTEFLDNPERWNRRNKV